MTTELFYINGFNQFNQKLMTELLRKLIRSEITDRYCIGINVLELTDSSHLNWDSLICQYTSREETTVQVKKIIMRLHEVEL